MSAHVERRLPAAVPRAGRHAGARVHAGEPDALHGRAHLTAELSADLTEPPRRRHVVGAREEACGRRRVRELPRAPARDREVGRAGHADVDPQRRRLDAEAGADTPAGLARLRDRSPTHPSAAPRAARSRRRGAPRRPSNVVPPPCDRSPTVHGCRPAARASESRQMSPADDADAGAHGRRHRARDLAEPDRRAHGDEHQRRNGQHADVLGTGLTAFGLPHDHLEVVRE